MLFGQAVAPGAGSSGFGAASAVTGGAFTPAPAPGVAGGLFGAPAASGAIGATGFGAPAAPGGLSPFGAPAASHLSGGSFGTPAGMLPTVSQAADAAAGAAAAPATANGAGSAGGAGSGPAEDDIAAFKATAFTLGKVGAVCDARSLSSCPLAFADMSFVRPLHRYSDAALPAPRPRAHADPGDAAATGALLLSPLDRRGA